MLLILRAGVKWFYLNNSRLGIDSSFINPQTMHILIILSDFQPAKNPNQLRFEMLIPELTQCGIQISILSNHWGATADTSEFGDARIYRVGPDFKNISNSNPSNLQKVRVLLRSLYQKFTWPDGRMVWILPGIRKGNYLLKHEQIDGIWSVGIPFSTHLIVEATACLDGLATMQEKYRPSIIE